MYKVLLIDDEPWITYGLQKLVKWEELDFGIIGQANDGQQAWQMILDEKPDVVVSDIRMPELDGLMLLEKIREEKLRIEAIMISGYADFEYAKKALQLGAFDYLVKQIKREALTACLKRLKEKMDEAAYEARTLQVETEKKERLGVDNCRVQMVLDQIDLRYGEKLSLQSMAEMLNVSQGYLSNMIKQETGYTFTEHLTKRRIDQAAELLADPELTIAEIADLTGYTDYFSFIKIFKKMTGYTPSQYRKM